mmetsp:Transcript_2368/g.3107  ORF Transcript_2368/g.3107 Transcript_2368/m.3107 type:complete len:100 (-) Transcript_2368:136-435(-)
MEHLRDVWEQATCGIIHGQVDLGLSRQIVDFVTSFLFNGHAIGGLLVSEWEETKELLMSLPPMIDSVADKPRHMLGIANKESSKHAVSVDIDIIDLCYP